MYRKLCTRYIFSYTIVHVPLVRSLSFLDKNKFDNPADVSFQSQPVPLPFQEIRGRREEENEREHGRKEGDKD